ncbi:unnamed protein product [Closterium sp. Naga37s-1]|nr:unnamed protein product [Closterium sp. Naga37s-1]
MRASGRSLTSLRLGLTPRDASHLEDPYEHSSQQQQQQQRAEQHRHAGQHSHAEQQRHAAEQHRCFSPVFLQHCPRLQQLHLERANWHLSSLHASWFKALRALTIHHSHCTASDFKFLAHITPQLQEFSLYVLNQGQGPSPLSLDFLMLIGRKRLVVASLPIASAKDVYLNAPSMHEESIDPRTNTPCPLQSSPGQPFNSRELYAPSVSESSLIRVLQSVAPTVEALMVPHSLPIESVEGEWRQLHRLAIGVRGSKAGGGRCKTTVEAAEALAGEYAAMASDRKEVLEEMAALNPATPSDAAPYRESLDVVDLLPGPIWHIIFRHLLLPPTDSTELQNQGNSLAELQEREGSISSVDTTPLSASKQHEENARCFGSSWPLLRLAMASKRLLHHVISFSVSH